VFTVEFESDASVIRTLDDTGEMSDVEMIIADDDVVFMRQWDEDLQKYEMLVMTYQQLLELFTSIHQTEGAFRTFKKEK